MDDKQQRSNIFELYASNQLQNRFAETDGTSKPESLTYAALEIEGDRQQLWLCLHEASGLIRLMPYADLRHVICAPFGWVGLQFNDAVITVEGHNLVPIVRLLQTRQLAAIHCFTDAYPGLPEDEEMPVVHKLIFQTYAEAEAKTETQTALPEITDEPN